jgi:hypothetical protein
VPHLQTEGTLSEPKIAIEWIRPAAAIAIPMIQTGVELILIPHCMQ